MDQSKSKVDCKNITDSNQEMLNVTGNDERYYFHVIEKENTSYSNDNGMGSSNASLPINENPCLNNINQTEGNDFCSTIVNDIHEIYKGYTPEFESQLEILMDTENPNYNIISPDIIDSISQTDPVDPVVNLTPNKQEENSEIVDNEEQNNIIDLIEISDEDENNEQETSHISQIVNITSQHTLRYAKNVSKILPLFKRKINFTVNFLNQKEINEQVNPDIKSSNGYQLKIGDLLLLITPRTWLNDNIIQNYISLLIDFCDQNVLELNTDFLISYKRNGYNFIYKWFKVKYPSLDNYQRIVIPINPDSRHWALLVVEIWEGKIYCADSFNHLYIEELTLASEFLNQIFIDYFQESSVKRAIPKNWKYEKWNSPKQSNTYDCGVFTCTNARYLLFNQHPDYTEKDIPLLRHRIAWELINHTIISF